jgi:mannose-6-phosphate isomerase-like protein (cupin superfamily)
VGESHLTFLLGSDQSQGHLMMVRYIVPTNYPGPPPHIHAHSDEAFYVLDGTLTITIGDRSIEATAGGMVFVPRGVAHTFANGQDELATMLVIMTPAGFEGYFQDMGALFHSGQIGTPGAVEAVQSRYDLLPAPTSAPDD